MQSFEQWYESEDLTEVKEFMEKKGQPAILSFRGWMLSAFYAGMEYQHALLSNDVQLAVQTVIKPTKTLIEVDKDPLL